MVEKSSGPGDVWSDGSPETVRCGQMPMFMSVLSFFFLPIHKCVSQNREHHTNLSCQHNKKLCYFHPWTGHALATKSEADTLLLFSVMAARPNLSALTWQMSFSLVSGPSFYLSVSTFLKRNLFGFFVDFQLILTDHLHSFVEH